MMEQENRQTYHVCFSVSSFKLGLLWTSYIPRRTFDVFNWEISSQVPQLHPQEVERFSCRLHFPLLLLHKPSQCPLFLMAWKWKKYNNYNHKCYLFVFLYIWLRIDFNSNLTKDLPFGYRAMALSIAAWRPSGAVQVLSALVVFTAERSGTFEIDYYYYRWVLFE